MSENDFEMTTEAGPSTLDVPSTTHASPLTFDLAAASCRLCIDIGISTLEEASRCGIPDALAQAAFAEDPSDVQLDQLLPALTHFASQSGTQDLIPRHFAPVLLQILSPWLEDASGCSVEVWETKLALAASLAAIRPEMWR